MMTDKGGEAFVRHLVNRQWEGTLHFRWNTRYDAGTDASADSIDDDDDDGDGDDYDVLKGLFIHSINVQPIRTS